MAARDEHEHQYEHEPARRAAGCTSARVSRAPSHPAGSTDVSSHTQIPDVEAAQSFLDNPELSELMKAAGVIGIPDIQITELVEAASY